MQLSGGSFPLTADTNFGTNFGLLAKYFTSTAGNPAGSGAIRLANSDAVGFRNSTNTADLLLKPDADGILQYNSIDIVNLSAAQTLTNKVLSGSANTFSNIGYSALNLSGSVQNSDVASSAGIAVSKLATQASNTILGNNSGSSAVPTALTAAQVNAFWKRS